jgi:hypothetical protein
MASGEPVSPHSHSHTNRLIHETSPYLLQHAYNPVDWHPWGEEAFSLAKRMNKAIFLSIGYSACHWCHVMAHESFEDEATAKLMNENFVNIKVDREEHPDVDRIYMESVTALTGRGGWPLSVFLTPELKPFYGGTYFRPYNPRGQQQGTFPFLLTAIAKAWESKRELIVADADKLSAHVKSLVSMSLPSDGSELPTNLLAKASAGLETAFDPKQGGFSGAPKFPPHGALELVLRQYRHDRDKDTLRMLTVTLDRMAAGGIYDQLGGGFARYAVDNVWLVPHFEKMLYDNAQLANIYLEAFQLTANPLYKKVARETLDYVLRDMTDAAGGFYAAEDADSEGEEGTFYVWSLEEITTILGKQAALFNEYFGVTQKGNFEGHNILNRPIPHEVFARDHELDPAELQSRLDVMRKKLMQVRDKRIRPGRDDKVLTAWNGLMISSFVLGYQALENPRYRDAALKAAGFMAATMMNDRGDLLHTYRNGKATLPAYQDDYAALILAFMHVYELSFDPAWLDRADLLTQSMIAKFWDEEAGTFFYTSSEHKHLLARSRSISDTQVPAGNSSAAMALLRLAKFIDNKDYFTKGERILVANKSGMERGGRWLGHMMVAADFYLDSPKEIAIVGPRDDAATAALLRIAHQNFLPNRIVALIDPDQDNADALRKQIPLLEHRPLLNGKPAAYVCENYTCKKPVSTAAELAAQLGLKQP